MKLGSRRPCVAPRAQTSRADVALHLDLRQESGGDGVKRIGWPRTEPVDGATVDQRREHAQAAAKGVADGGHGQADVQKVAAALDEEGEHGGKRAVSLAVLFSRHVVHSVANLCALIGREEVGYLACVQQAVDVLQACKPQDGLEILAPVGHRVGLGHLDGKNVHVANVCGEARGRLTAGTADPGEQRIAAGHLQHACQPAYVLHREEEEHQLHRLGRDGVVVIEKLIHGAAKRLSRLDALQIADRVVLNLAVAADRQGVFLEQLGHGLVKVPRHQLDGHLAEPCAVIHVGQAVVEDAIQLVAPAHDEVGRLCIVLHAGEEHALHHARDIPQVERVVRLGGRGQQVGNRLLALRGEDTPSGRTPCAATTQQSFGRCAASTRLQTPCTQRC
eukprot:scaffold2872_cov112-Isochrysis_galbana.AAC.16